MRITFTSAPITPKLVSLKYSNGLDLLDVLRKGYRYKGIRAANSDTKRKRISQILRKLFFQNRQTKDFPQNMLLRA